MRKAIIITGTDTGIGKTVFSAAMTRAIDGYYWKPVQSGLDEETDSQAVMRLGAIAAARVLPEAYRLRTPASPHLAARLDGITIDPARLTLPETDATLIIEGAGGLLVPLNERLLLADMFARWQLPVILCSRTTLGTINHTLLSLEALKSRGIPVMGVAFLGEENGETQRIVAELGRVPILGRLPRLPELTQGALSGAFEDGFDVMRIKGGLE
jgi:dethiobiotin synthetase